MTQTTLPVPPVRPPLVGQEQRDRCPAGLTLRRTGGPCRSGRARPLGGRSRRAPGPHPAAGPAAAKPSPPHPAAFAQDDKARALCLKGLTLGVDKGLSPLARVFFYLPLEHAESREQQARSVALFEALADEQATGPARATFEGFADFARRHQVIVERFGRFPTATPSWAGRARRKRPPSCNSPVRGSDIKNPRHGHGGERTTDPRITGCDSGRSAGGYSPWSRSAPLRRRRSPPPCCWSAAPPGLSARPGGRWIPPPRSARGWPG